MARLIQYHIFSENIALGNAMRRSTVGGSSSRVRRVEVPSPKEAEITMAHQTTTIPTATFRVSVLCSRKTGRVLFLEAGKDFVDTLLSFLLLPVGTIINMLSRGDVDVKALGGISCIFGSVKDLDPSFLHVDRENLVAPKPAAGGSCNPTGLLQSALEAASCTPPKLKVENLPKDFYGCPHQNCNLLTTKYGGYCARGYAHQRAMSVLPKDLEDLWEEIVRVVDAKKASSSGQGFVRENITYMVTDNLEIMPSTTIRSINVLNKLKVATLADLESSEKTISITQVLQLLQAALTSSTCLNDVFGVK